MVRQIVTAPDYVTISSPYTGAALTIVIVSSPAAPGGDDGQGPGLWVTLVSLIPVMWHQRGPATNGGHIQVQRAAQRRVQNTWIEDTLESKHIYKQNLAF